MEAEITNTVTETKACFTCKNDLPVSQFTQKTPTKLQSNCTACVSAYSRKWHVEHLERRLTQLKARKKASVAAVTPLLAAVPPCASCKRDQTKSILRKAKEGYAVSTLTKLIAELGNTCARCASNTASE